MCIVSAMFLLTPFSAREFAADHTPQTTGVMGTQDFLIDRRMRLALASPPDYSACTRR